MATGTALSNFSENLILNWLLTTGTATRPTAWYVSLHTADPTDAGTGAEVTGGSYARVSATFTTATTGTNGNVAAVTFPTATASWGTVTHVGIWDASATGNLLYYGALTSSAAINTGTTYNIPIGSLAPALD